MSTRAIFLTLFAILTCSAPVFAGSDAEKDKQAIAVFLESDVVTRFHKALMAMRFSQPLVKEALVSEPLTVRAVYIETEKRQATLP